MQKILVLVAVVFSLAAAALGYLNRSHLVMARQEAVQYKDQSSANAKKAEKSAADLKAANEKIAIINSDIEKNASELMAARSEKEKAVSTQADLQKQLSDKDAALAQQKTDIAAKDARIAELESKTSQAAPQGDSSSADLKKQLEEKDILTSSLQTKLKDQESQLSALKEREAQRKSKTMKPGLTGRVLAVNSSWNFVVISLGDRNGVVNGAEMLVYRANQLLGKVRITSVEPSTSIADIVSNSLRGGLSIQPGDNVIYPNPSEESEARILP